MKKIFFDIIWIKWKQIKKKKKAHLGNGNGKWQTTLDIKHELF